MPVSELHDLKVAMYKVDEKGRLTTSVVTEADYIGHAIAFCTSLSDRPIEHIKIESKDGWITHFGRSSHNEPWRILVQDPTTDNWDYWPNSGMFAHDKVPT